MTPGFRNGCARLLSRPYPNPLEVLRRPDDQLGGLHSQVQLSFILALVGVPFRSLDEHRSPLVAEPSTANTEGTRDRNKGDRSNTRTHPYTDAVVVEPTKLSGISAATACVGIVYGHTRNPSKCLAT